jgi:excisionase family DNA binding protein
MSGDLIAIPLPDGRWLGLTREALQAALAAGTALGLGPSQSAETDAADSPFASSEQVGAMMGVHSTTVEAMAKAGTIPSIRVGRLLRFEPAAVKASLRKNGRSP